MASLETPQGEVRSGDRQRVWSGSGAAGPGREISFGRSRPGGRPRTGEASRTATGVGGPLPGRQGRSFAKAIFREDRATRQPMTGRKGDLEVSRWTPALHPPLAPAPLADGATGLHLSTSEPNHDPPRPLAQGADFTRLRRHPLHATRSLRRSSHAPPSRPGNNPPTLDGKGGQPKGIARFRPGRRFSDLLTRTAFQIPRRSPLPYPSSALTGFSPRRTATTQVPPTRSWRARLFG